MVERVKLKPTGRGGPGRGQGRKPGSGNRRLAQDNIDKAAAAGMLPHEFLLAIVRGERITRKVVERIVDPETGDPIEIVTEIEEKYEFKDRQAAARDAAPYFAPRISTVEVISGVADADLDAIIKGAATEAGISLGFGGEGTQGEVAGSEGSSDSASSRTPLEPD